VTPAPVREAPPAAARAAAPTPAKGALPPKAAAPGKGNKRNLTPVGGIEDLPPEPVEFIDSGNWLATIDEAK
jgi:hypothetical protein